MDRRTFLESGLVGAAALATARWARAEVPGIEKVYAEIEKRHPEAVLRLQEWSPGSWPGYVFTGAPLRLPAGRFGLGNGDGAHAPNEYFLVETKNPKVQGFDGAVRSYVDYLYELASNA